MLVALVENGRPVAVAGYQPTTRLLLTATRDGGAWVRCGQSAWQRVRLEPAGDRLRIGTSKWFGAPGNAAIIDSVANRLGAVLEEPAVTGFSPRMFLAPRAIDVMIGVRPGADQTMASEWDFAVADLVIHEAGGMVTDLSGQQFRYNKPVPHNFGGLIAAADPASHARVLAALQHERGESVTLDVAIAPLVRFCSGDEHRAAKRCARRRKRRAHVVMRTSSRTIKRNRGNICRCYNRSRERDGDRSGCKRRWLVSQRRRRSSRCPVAIALTSASSAAATPGYGRRCRSSGSIPRWT